MLLKVKGQSTAEYAILIALVAAVAAGFLSVSLKGAIRNKNQQASDYLMKAAVDTRSGTDLLAGFGADNVVPLYTQEVSKTTLQGGADVYKNVQVLEKGGSERKYQKQTTASEAVSVETLEANVND
jgi:Flp pilus assembly pilin Flp